MDTPDNAGSEDAPGKRISDIDLQRWFAAYPIRWFGPGDIGTRASTKLPQASEKKAFARENSILRSRRVR